jgi:hypothetical protein
MSLENEEMFQRNRETLPVLRQAAAEVVQYAREQGFTPEVALIRAEQNAGEPVCLLRFREDSQWLAVSPERVETLKATMFSNLSGVPAYGGVGLMTAAVC